MSARVFSGGIQFTDSFTFEDFIASLGSDLDREKEPEYQPRKAAAAFDKIFNEAIEKAKERELREKKTGVITASQQGKALLYMIILGNPGDDSSRKNQAGRVAEAVKNIFDRRT